MQTPAAMFSDGAAYERLMGRWSKQVGGLFLDWLALPPGLDWLDAGCGNGAFTEVISSRAAPASVVGIDPSPGQIDYARQRRGAAGASFDVGDAQSMPFADESFDVAGMALVIAFIPDPAKALAELARVTRPGGTIATYMWDLPGGVPMAPFHRELLALGHSAALPPSADAASLAALGSLWRDAGLTGVETRTFQMSVTFADFDDFWQSNSVAAGPVAAALRNLSGAETDELRQRLRDGLPTEKVGRITYGALANAVRGRRP